MYRFCTNDFVDPLKRRYYAHFYVPFDIKLFELCLQRFIGTHDFRAFANRVEHTTKNLASQGEDHQLDTMRTIYSIQVISEGDGCFRVELHLKSALYRMVRNIVGTSLDVAAGKFDEEYLSMLLKDAPSRYDNKAKSAPPEGLTLERVFYDELFPEQAMAKSET